MMQKIGTEYSKFVGFEPMPNESQCPVCGYFDTTHPDVQRILQRRVTRGMTYEYLLTVARCKCLAAAAAEKAKDEMRHQQANAFFTAREYTFGNFQVTHDTQEMFDVTHSFSLGEGPPILMLMGGPGVGKSHLLQAAVRATVERGRQARYELVSTLLDRLRSCYELDSEEDLMGLTSWYQGRYLLALDDLGLERGTDWAREKLTALVEDRIRMGYRTIISTNLGEREMAERLGERLASRLYATNPDIQSVKIVAVDAQDYRKR